MGSHILKTITMKNAFLLVLFSLVISSSMLGQQKKLPIDTTIRDQVVQGPCYIFATVAALESKAIQNGVATAGTDFYEWNLYSKYTLGSLSPNGHNMVKKVLAHAQKHGVYSVADVGSAPPSLPAHLPNITDPAVPGIADLDCDPDFSSKYYEQIDEGNCTDNENRDFAISNMSGSPFKYSDSTLFYYTANPSQYTITMSIFYGYGVIAFFDDWMGTDTSHAVFIYGYNGNQWYYKDSWPGQAGLKLDTLPIATKCTSAYMLSGNMSYSPPPVCTASITGPNPVSNIHQYQLTGPGNYTNVNWSINGNLILDYQSNSSITVHPGSGCGNSTGMILASYTSAGQSCTTDFPVTIQNFSQQPNGILVQSPDWNNGQTCPGTLLELEVDDNENPNYPYTTYEWNIQGASIVSGGNGLPYISVMTSNSPGTTPLNFKVRARRSNCSVSSWRSLTGISSSSGCFGGGGGGLRIGQWVQMEQQLYLLDLANGETLMKEAHYQILSVDGRVLDRGKVSAHSPRIDLSRIREQLLLIHFYNQEHRFRQTVSVFHTKN